MSELTVHMNTRTSLLDELTEAVYEAALEPGSWGGVMRRMHSVFGSTSETFYLLDPQRNSVRTLHISGIAESWLAGFSDAYFSPGNPWVGLSNQLHQPGTVRTNERLIEFTRDREVLYRSSYYNEWMRPQGFRYTIGNTLVREPGLIANVTLLRSADMRTFDSWDVRAFEQLSRHMTRALRVGLRFDALQAQRQPVLQALDALPQAVLLLDPQGKLLYVNGLAEALLRADRGIASAEGRLIASRPTEQPALQALLRRCDKTLPDSAAGGPDTVTLRSRKTPHAPPLTLSAMPLAAGQARYRQGQRAILVLAAEASAVAAAPDAVLQALYGLTVAETRLARNLATGDNLRSAAERSGIRYGTARGYLKALFQKTGTHRQAELLKCLLCQNTPKLRPPE